MYMHLSKERNIVIYIYCVHIYIYFLRGSLHEHVKQLETSATFAPPFF